MPNKVVVYYLLDSMRITLPIDGREDSLKFLVYGTNFAISKYMAIYIYNRNDFLCSAAEESFLELGDIRLVKDSFHYLDAELFALLQDEDSGDSREYVIFWSVDFSSNYGKEVGGDSF